MTSFLAKQFETGVTELLSCSEGLFPIFFNVLRRLILKSQVKFIFVPGHGLDSSDCEASSKEKLTTSGCKGFSLEMLKVNEKQPRAGE